MKKTTLIVFVTFLFNGCVSQSQVVLGSEQKEDWQPIPNTFLGTSSEFAIALRKELDPKFEPKSVYIHEISIEGIGAYDLVYFMDDVDQSRKEASPWLVAFYYEYEEDQDRRAFYRINHRLEVWYPGISLAIGRSSTSRLDRDARVPEEIRNLFVMFPWEEVRLNLWGVVLDIKEPVP